MEQKHQPPLLVSRVQASEMLGGISVASIIRLEREGRLKPVRLSRSPTAQVFFRMEDVMALIDGVSKPEA